MIRSGWLAGVLVGMLVACGGSRDRGPAWPKPSPSETDGGESLAPRQPSAVAAIEEAGDATPSAPAPSPAASSAATPAAAPAARPDRPASEAPPPREPEILITDELIIEIDD